MAENRVPFDGRARRAQEPRRRVGRRVGRGPRPRDPPGPHRPRPQAADQARQRVARPASPLGARRARSPVAFRWHYGLPALLGPEPAYRRLRRDDLDYVECRSAADALDAVAALRADPARYRAMRARCRYRASSDYSRAALAAAWAAVLFRDP